MKFDIMCSSIFFMTTLRHRDPPHRREDQYCIFALEPSFLRFFKMTKTCAIYTFLAFCSSDICKDWSKNELVAKGLYK